MKLVGDAHLADDLVQETWTRALQSPPPRGRSLRRWLTVVLRNLAFEGMRTGSRREARERDVAREEAAEGASVGNERFELHRVLVEAISELGEPYRQAILMRYFDDLPPRKIAAQLGIPSKTVKMRLHRGLALLREGLDRRYGQRYKWLTVMTPILPKGGWTWPAAIRTTTKAVVVSTFATAAAVAIVAVGVYPVFSSRMGEPARVVGQPSAKTTSELQAPEVRLPERLVEETVRMEVPLQTASGGLDFEFSGRVVGPDGAPFSGAEVVASVYGSVDHAIRTLSAVRTDDRGHFTLGYDKQDLPLSSRPELWKWVSLSAHAPGHGADWVWQGELESLDEVTLRLVADQVLTGQLVDEDGQPLAGALVRLESLMASVDESLAGWQEALEGGAQVQEAHATLNKYLHFPVDLAPSARTNEDGQFELHGIGRERLPWLEYHGGGAAYGLVRMVTRVVDSSLLARANEGALEPVHSSGAVVVGRRARPIEGVLRDASTGEPLAGVDVFSHTINFRSGMAFGAYQRHKLRARTDAEGRFLLLGMPKASGNRLIVVPGDDEPYFMREVDIPDPDGMAPIRIEVLLTRGVWITGKVVDGATGRPGHGLISYHPHLLNELVQEIDQFKNLTVDGFRGRYRTKPDGTFRIVGLPGRGLVGVESFGEYHQGAGCDPAWELNEDGELLFLRQSVRSPSPTWPTAMCLVEIPAYAASVDCELSLESGQTVTLDLVDPQGEPVAGFEVTSVEANYYTMKIEGALCEVRRLGPAEERLVWIQVPDRDLGAVTRVRAGENERRSLTLEPRAKIRGRVVDEDGVPVGESPIQLYFMPEERPTGQSTVTEEDGSFTVEGVIPGSGYRLFLFGQMYAVLVEDTAGITPGEDVDLGVVVVKRP